jgi:hypothetical protein
MEKSAYRVLKKLDPEGNYLYGIYEVYFDEDGTIMGHTDEALSPMELSVKELKQTLKAMTKGADSEILDFIE